MAIPVSVDMQFRRLDKYLRELKQLEEKPEREEESVIVADICNSCMLLLDKAMNAVWTGTANKPQSRGKPNIYFPTCATKEKLNIKLQQYQLPNMEVDNPRLFALIDSVQAYNNVPWLGALHKVAGIRHEEFPKIRKKETNGIGIGKGQDLYIDSLIIDGNGKMSFKGHGINRETGKREAARIELKKEVQSVLEGIGEEPYAFCSSSVSNVKRLTIKIYSLI